MKLIRVTKLDGIDIVVNTAHILYIEISDEGWSWIQMPQCHFIVKQSFNEIIKLSKEA